MRNFLDVKKTGALKLKFATVFSLFLVNYQIQNMTTPFVLCFGYKQMRDQVFFDAALLCPSNHLMQYFTARELSQLTSLGLNFTKKAFNFPCRL